MIHRALTFEQRRELREARGELMRKRYRRELRMNLSGESRPIDSKAARLGPLREL